MNPTKPIPRYSHPPLIGAYSYKMTPLLSVTPSKRSNAKPPSLIKTHIQSQKENSNSFSNINKQINSMKTNACTCTSGNTQAMMMMMTHPIYTKRKNVKVKNRKISSNDVKSMITLNKNEEYSITCENNNNNNITMTNSNSNNKDDGSNHISTYMKNVALQQSYVKKRPNNRSFIRMSSTCVGNNNVSSYFSNSNSNNNNNANNAHFMHYFDRDCNYHNNNNYGSVINNSSNISFINNHHAINTSHLGNYNTNNNITKLQPHQHTHNTHHLHTTHIPTYIPSSSNDDISEYFTYTDEKDHDLTKDEKEIYGTREMKGYQKLKLLGK